MALGWLIIDDNLFASVPLRGGGLLEDSMTKTRKKTASKPRKSYRYYVYADPSQDRWTFDAFGRPLGYFYSFNTKWEAQEFCVSCNDGYGLYRVPVRSNNPHLLKLKRNSPALISHFPSWPEPPEPS